MIGIVDVSIQAHNVSMPLYPMRAFEGSPSSIRVRSVPKKIGNWQINKVYFSVAYPDNTTQTIECKLVGGVYVATIDGCDTVGNVKNGYSIYADGTDENGNAVTDYCLGKGDIQILDARGITEPLKNTKFVQILSSEPATPNEGDMWQTSGAWYVWQDGEAWAIGDDSGRIDELSADLSTKLAIADFNDFKTNEFTPEIQNLSDEITATNGNVTTARQDIETISANYIDRQTFTSFKIDTEQNIESLSSDKLDASTFNDFKSYELTAYALSTDVQNELATKADASSLTAYATIDSLSAKQDKLNDAQISAIDSVVSGDYLTRKEAEDGYTKWVITPPYFDEGIPFDLTYQEQYGWVLGIHFEGGGEAIGFSYGPQDVTTLTYTNIENVGTVTAERYRITPTKTSQLSNDGADGINPFATVENLTAYVPTTQLSDITAIKLAHDETDEHSTRIFIDEHDNVIVQKYILSGWYVENVKVRVGATVDYVDTTDYWCAVDVKTTTDGLVFTITIQDYARTLKAKSFTFTSTDQSITEHIFQPYWNNAETGGAILALKVQCEYSATPIWVNVSRLVPDGSTQSGLRAAQIAADGTFVTPDQVEPSINIVKYAKGAENSVRLLKPKGTARVDQTSWVQIHPENSRFCIADKYYPSWYLSKYNGTTIDPPIEMKWGYFESTTYWSRRQVSITLNSWAWVATTLYPQTGNVRNRFYIKANTNDDGYITSLDDKFYVSTTAHDITFSSNRLSIETFDGSSDVVECTRDGELIRENIKYFVLEDDLSAKADVSALTAYALSTDVANALTNYLPLSGGTLSSGNASIEVAPTHIIFHNDYTLTSDNQQVLHVKNPTTIDFALLSSDGIDGTSLQSQLLAKQDVLADEQVSAIDSVVDKRRTIVDYGNGNISSFNIVGTVTSALIPNIKTAVDIKLGEAVTEIGPMTFTQCTELTNITIPNSVSAIGGGSLQSCDKLSSITIPNSVKTIGSWTFFECDGLTSISVPDSVTYLGGGAFYACRNLNTIWIPNTSMRISADAFFQTAPECTVYFKNADLSDVGQMEDCPWGLSIVNNIKTWNDASQEWVNKQLTAKADVTDLTSKADVASLNNYQPKLSANQVSAINQVLDERQTVIDFGTYGIGRYDWVGELNKDVLAAAGLYDTSQSRWTKQPIDVKLGTTISSVGYGVFQSCQQLTSITMPDSIKSIGGYAFAGCMSLAKADLPSELSSIGDGAFVQNFALSSIHLPSTLKSMGSGAFQYCAMTDLQIAEGVTDIGSGAFTQSDSLKHVEFPSSISAIGSNAFQGSNSLTSVVFKDKTFGQISAMANYPWYISDPGNVITTYTPASQEWVKEYIAQYIQEHNA